MIGLYYLLNSLRGSYLKHIRGIVFDLDGTLVTSNLDFSLIRSELGCPDGLDVLAYVDQLCF